jgi:hypothetical protein
MNRLPDFRELAGSPPASEALLKGGAEMAVAEFDDPAMAPVQAPEFIIALDIAVLIGAIFALGWFAARAFTAWC